MISAKRYGLDEDVLDRVSWGFTALLVGLRRQYSARHSAAKNYPPPGG